MNEYLAQFLVEGRELVEQASGDLLALEGNPGDRPRLDAAFRAFHTLKGLAGIVDFAAMSRAMHAVEDVLVHVRNGGQSVTVALIGNCLASLDDVTVWLDALEANDGLPTDADPRADEIIARFAAPTASPQPVAAEPKPAPVLSTAVLEDQLAMLKNDAIEKPPGLLGSIAKTAANVLRGAGRSDDAARFEALAKTRDIAGLTAAIESVLRPLQPAPAQPAEPVAARADRMLRIDVRRIDELVKLAGELTVAKNAIAHAAQLARDAADPKRLAALLTDQHGRLDRLVSELQRAVVNIRVVPLRQTFQRFQRQVREIALTVGKNADLLVTGEATEADKSVVEALSEPLLHVLRNAIDHGLEGPDDRRAAGKPAAGTIHLRAERRGEHVIIEVEDDGRGIDVAKIRRLAAERGLASAEALAAMPEADVTDFIFQAGFSTARQVTGLSGRGVGMDAVRSAVTRLGGRVTVESRWGLGTTVRLILPFAMMMSQIITVEVNGQMFGLPMEAVQETVKLSHSQIRPVGAAKAFVLRDMTVPLLDLAETLGESVRPAARSEANVVVVHIDGQTCGIQVDRLGDRMQVMLQPPDGLLAGMPSIAGTTLLGDGRVLIVLDLGDLLD